MLSLAACRAVKETRPAARPAVGVAGRAPLDILPADQYFTYVSAPTLFSGVVGPDTLNMEPRRIAGFRRSVQIPLASMGWNESVPELATFRIAVIEVDRVYRGWRRFGGCYSQTFSNALLRGFAIERVSDGAVFWRLYPGGQLDQSLIEKRASEDITRFVLGLVTPFPVSEVPPRHLFCAGSGMATASVPTSTPASTPASTSRPTTAPASPPPPKQAAPDAPRPTPPPVRRPDTDAVSRP
jgi:hypothetical protein